MVPVNDVNANTQNNIETLFGRQLMRLDSNFKATDKNLSDLYTNCYLKKEQSAYLDLIRLHLHKLIEVSRIKLQINYVTTKSFIFALVCVWTSV